MARYEHGRLGLRVLVYRGELLHGVCGGPVGERCLRLVTTSALRIFDRTFEPGRYSSSHS